MQTTLARLKSARAVISASRVNDELHNRVHNGLNAGCVNIIENNVMNRSVLTAGETALFFSYRDDMLREHLDLVCSNPRRAYELAQAGLALRDQALFRFSEFHNILELAQTPFPTRTDFGPRPAAIPGAIIIACPISGLFGRPARIDYCCRRCSLSYGLIVILGASFARYALAQPNARSSHKQPTPQGGGIAVIGAIIVVIAGCVLAGVDLNNMYRLGMVLCVAVLLALVATADDVRPLGAAPRLVLQIAAAILVVAAIPPELRIVQWLPFWLERGAVLLGMVWFINLVNFMDGIDWMSVAEAVPLTAGLTIFGLMGELPRDATVAGPASLALFLDSRHSTDRSHACFSGMSVPADRTSAGVDAGDVARPKRSFRCGNSAAALLRCGCNNHAVAPVHTRGADCRGASRPFLSARRGRRIRHLPDCQLGFLAQPHSCVAGTRFGSKSVRRLSSDPARFRMRRRRNPSLEFRRGDRPARPLGQQSRNSPADGTHSMPQETGVCWWRRILRRRLLDRTAVKFKNQVASNGVAHVLHAVHFARRVIDDAERLNSLAQSFNLT